MFYRLVLADNSILSKYQYMLYLEQDVVAIRPEWLTALAKEASRHKFLILGSLPIRPSHPTCLACNLTPAFRELIWRACWRTACPTPRAAATSRRRGGCWCAQR